MHHPSTFNPSIHASLPLIDMYEYYCHTNLNARAADTVTSIIPTPTWKNKCRPDLDMRAPRAAPVDMQIRTGALQIEVQFVCYRDIYSSYPSRRISLLQFFDSDMDLAANLRKIPIFPADPRGPWFVWTPCTQIHTTIPAVRSSKITSHISLERLIFLAAAYLHQSRSPRAPTVIECIVFSSGLIKAQFGFARHARGSLHLVKSKEGGRVPQPADHLLKACRAVKWMCTSLPSGSRAA
ncbi:hypothetical protein FB451DRAFT_1569212 [Mycena latifolia]|nr:hypothetical protein FB451DRAFT_1569212 [Mycena latifolia]